MHCRKPVSTEVDTTCDNACLPIAELLVFQALLDMGMLSNSLLPKVAGSYVRGMLEVSPHCLCTLQILVRYMFGCNVAQACVAHGCCCKTGHKPRLGPSQVDSLQPKVTYQVWPTKSEAVVDAPTVLLQVAVEIGVDLHSTHIPD